MIITAIITACLIFRHLNAYPETYGEPVGLNGIGWGITIAGGSITAEMIVDFTLLTMYYFMFRRGK